jgi:MFS family permease
MDTPPDGRRAVLGRAFRLVQLATGISGLGDGLVLAAFPLLAARLTDDPRLVVAVTVVGRLPWLLVALPAGALVDRSDRRRLVVRVETARAVLLAAFAVAVFTGHDTLGVLLVTVFLVGAGETVVSSASHAVLPDLVAPQRLANANGTLFATQTATEDLLGPAIGGVLFAAAVVLPFAVDAVSFAVAALLLAVALPRGLARPESAPATHLRHDVAEGFAYFIHHPTLRLIGVLTASLAFCQAIVFGPLVLFALDGLGLSDAGYGLLLGVAAIGNVVGGTVAGRLDQQFGARVLLPAGGVLAAAAYIVCGMATSVALAAVALGVEAVAVALGNVANLTLRQRLIPSELLGRVGNVLRFFIFGAVPIGGLVGGSLVQWFGVRAPFAGAAALQLVAVAVVAPPLVRKLGAMAPASAG